MIKIVLLIFLINWVANEVEIFAEKLPLWYCFKCFTFWISLTLLLFTEPLIDAILIAGFLSFLASLYGNRRF